MLTGQVTSEHEAVLDLEVFGAGGRTAQIEVVIDTGFNGYLTLPRTLIQELDLSFIGPARAALGDGKEVGMDLYLASVQWADDPRDVLVLEAEGGALIGMALLAGFRLLLDVEAGGAVSIESLARIRGVN